MIKVIIDPNSEEEDILFNLLTKSNYSAHCKRVNVYTLNEEAFEALKKEGLAFHKEEVQFG